MCAFFTSLANALTFDFGFPVMLFQQDILVFA